jgi:hypothetical protein
MQDRQVIMKIQQDETKTKQEELFKSSDASGDLSVLLARSCVEVARLQKENEDLKLHMTLTLT